MYIIGCVYWVTLIYLYYKGILFTFLLDKLPNNVWECITCISKTIIQGQFKVCLAYISINRFFT